MHTSAPLKSGHKGPSMFEWENGEIIKVDEKRLLLAEKLKTRSVQLSFFLDQEGLEEVEEELESGTATTNAKDIVESSIEWVEEESSVV